MTIEIDIENLKCGGCAATIIKGLTALEDVTEVTVNVAESIVTIASNKDVKEMVKVKLAKLGYPEVGDKNTVLHKAKSFVSCAVGRIDS